MEWMKEVPDNYYELAIVDPPYGITRFERPSGTTRFNSSKRMQEEGLKWDKAPNKDYFTELFRISKNQIIWGANNFTLPPSEYFCIWDKQQTVDNFASAEYAWVSMGLKKPAKIFRYGIHKHNHTEKIHPTQKPVQLYEWLLLNYAKHGDKIFDSHFGSLSIGIACHNLGFQLDACELDKEYYESAKERLIRHQSQLTMFAGQLEAIEEDKQTQTLF